MPPSKRKLTSSTATPRGSARSIAGQRRTVRVDAESTPRRRRVWSTVAAVIAASGVLAAVTGFAVNEYFTSTIDRAKDALGDSPFDIPLQRMLGPEDDRNTGWASDAPLPSELIGSTDSDAIGTRLSSAGFVAVNRSVVEVVIRNNRSETAVITSIKSVIVHTGPAKSATLVVPETGGGQTEGPISIGFKLDSPDHEAFASDGQSHYLDANGLELAAGETLRVNAIGGVSSTYVEWHLRVEFVLDGKARSLDIGSASPFRTTAALTTYPNVFSWTFGGLKQMSPQEFCSGDCKAKFFGED